MTAVRFGLFFLSVSFCCFGAIQSPAAERASVVWLETAHDFGTIEEDSGEVFCRMRFVNVGRIPAAIVNVRATCGCTMPYYSKEPIAPGDTGVVQIKYNPAARPGRFEKKVFVDLNTMPERQALAISGVVKGSTRSIKSRYPVDAGSLKLDNQVVAFGEITKGKAKSVFLEAYNQTSDTIYPKFGPVPSYISISMAPEAVPPGEQTTFVFYFNTLKSSQWGLVEDELTLFPAPDGEGFDLSTVAVVNEDFSSLTAKQREKAAVAAVSTELLDFDRLKRDQGKCRGSFTIKNAGKSPLLIRRVYTTDKTLSVSAAAEKLGKGKRAEVIVEVDPSLAEGGLIDAWVTIVTNDPVNPRQKVRVTAEIK